MKRRILTRRRILLTALCISTILALYLGLLIFPGACFAYEFRYEHIVVRSDEPIPASAAAVLKETTMRLARSPLSANMSQPGEDRRIYVCNRPWRFLLFTNFRYRVAGLTYAPITNNIFVRAVRFDADRLVSPSGVDVPGDRTLSYFLAHEITHTLVADHLGAFGYSRLPVWKDEGYADYIGKGSAFDYSDAVRRLQNGAPEMDPLRSGQYLGYHVLVAYLLDEKGLGVEEFFRETIDADEQKKIINESALPRRE